MPSMPKVMKHADPGSQLPLPRSSYSFGAEGAADAKLEQRAAVVVRAASTASAELPS
jgi:hypothetical protein